VGEAAADLVVAADGAVKGAVDAAASGDLDLKASIGLGCALTELEDVGAALEGASTDIQASVSAVTMIAGSVNAG
jgi:hypothetical protein